MELERFYRDIILDHARQPRNCRGLTNPDLCVETYNPLCGDRLELMLGLKGNRIESIGIRVRGCAICQASASMMSELIEKKTLDEAKALGAVFRSVLVGENCEGHNDIETLKPLLKLRSQKPRHRCVLLVWDALADCGSVNSCV